MRQISPGQPVAEATYNALRDAICTSNLRPGERLVQNDLAQRLGISRLPVHEALQQLRQEGFVIETGRRGLVVSPLEPDFVLQLFELRAALDRTAAMSAARARRPGDEARGMAIVERGRKGLASDNLAMIATADRAFHELVYQIGGNPLIAATAQRNSHHVRRAFLSLIKTVTPELAIFWEDHTAILAAITRGDEDEAGRLSWDHTMRSGQTYATELRRQVGAANVPGKEVEPSAPIIG